MRDAVLVCLSIATSACGSAPEAAAPTEPATPVEVAEARPAIESAPVSSTAQPIATAEHVDPSCAALPSCNGESCCTQIRVPGGAYFDKKAGKVEVRDFYLDKYELTVGRVRAWVDAGSPTPTDDGSIGHDSEGRTIRWQKGWRVMSDAQLKGWQRYDTWRVGKVDLPKNFIDWYTSAAVCHFAGGRLPSDAEWRYAAVGGDQNRPYPWGSEAQTPERAVYNCTGNGDVHCSLADVVAVGSRPLGAGRWGHQDLAGSMFEWTADAGGSPETVARGGGFCYIGGHDRRHREIETAENLRRDPPNSTSHMVGARCAHDAAPSTEMASR
jgi:formylglycine-generating enzyme required for sulfatase activity